VRPKVLIIDNYDSFVYNLAQALGELRGEIIVFRNDKITVDKAVELEPDRIVISPGPGSPVNERYFGASSQIISEMGKTIPTLGVCLGHQGIAHIFGARIRRAKTVKHGKTSLISHDEKTIYEGIQNPFPATRYHSLAVDRESLSSEIIVTAQSQDDGEIMGLRHRSYPIEGIQYHPESILTKVGTKILENFLYGETRG
jgi:anthranilate synthase component 2